MKRTHFFYSEKQKGKINKCFVTISGKRIRYTECRIGKRKPSGLWDDYHYLGSVPERKFFDFVDIETINFGEKNEKSFNNH